MPISQEELASLIDQTNTAGTAPARTTAGNGDIEGIIRERAEANGVDPDTMVSLARRESSLNPSARNKVSSAGGLFQFLDGTWAQYGNGDKLDPYENADAAARMMRDNLARFDGDYDVALAAHHVGPGKARRAVTDNTIGDVHTSTMNWLADIRADRKSNGIPPVAKATAPKAGSSLEMPTDGELANQGIDADDISRLISGGGGSPSFSTNFSGMAKQSTEGQKPEDGGFIDAASRGIKMTWPQTKQLMSGAIGLAADKLGADSVRDWAMKNYHDLEGDVEKLSRDTDSFTEAGSANLGKFVGYWTGYVGGQLLESVAVAVAGAGVGAVAGGGVGSVAGAGMGGVAGFLVKQEVKDVIKKGAEKVIANIGEASMKKGLSRAEADVLAKAASDSYISKAIGKAAGSNAGLWAGMGAQNFGMEAGEIYGEIYKQAKAEGREVTEEEKNRAIAFGIAAGAMETVFDKFNLDALVGAGAKSAGIGGRLAGFGREALKAEAREIPTEMIQTGLERAGKGQEWNPQNDEAYKEYIDTIAGVAAGSWIPGVGGLRLAKTPPAPPPAPVLQPNSPIQNAAATAQHQAAMQAPPAVDPFDDAVTDLGTRMADRGLYQQIRDTPELGPDALSEILASYRVATNTGMEPRVRAAAIDRLNQFFESFDNQPNFTVGARPEEAGNAFDQPAFPQLTSNEGDPIEGSATRMPFSVPDQPQLEAPSVLSGGLGAVDQAMAGGAVRQGNRMVTTSGETSILTPAQIARAQRNERAAQNENPVQDEAGNQGGGDDQAGGAGYSANPSGSAPGDSGAVAGAVPADVRLGSTNQPDPALADRFNPGDTWSKDGHSYTIDSVSEDGKLGVARFKGGDTYSVHFDAEKANGWNPESAAAPAAAGPQVPAPAAAEAAQKPLSLGKTPNQAWPITVKDGVVLVGDYPALDYETGDDVTVPEGATPHQIADALRSAGSLAGGQKIFGLPSVAQASQEPAGATPDAARVKPGRRMAPLQDDRLANEDVRAELATMPKDAGWSQTGGIIIRDANHNVTGRTTWIPSAPWFAAGMGNPAEVEAHVQAALSGAPLSAHGKRVVQTMLDYITERVMPHLNALPEGDAIREALNEESEDALAAFEAISDAALSNDEELSVAQNAADFSNLLDILDDIEHSSVAPDWMNDEQATPADQVAEEARGAGEAVGPAAGDAQEGGEAGPGLRVEEEEGLALSGQTNQEAAAEFAAKKAAEDTEKKAKAAAEAKAKADSEANDFRLAGSDRPADIAVAGGQASLLDAPQPASVSVHEMGGKAFASGEQRVAPGGLSLADKARWYGGWDAANLAAPVVEQGVDDQELAQIVEEFNAAQQSEQEAEYQVTHVFDAPPKNEIVRLADAVKVYHKDHGWMTPAEAKQRLQEWKDHAASQYDDQNVRNDNSQRVVLSLFDRTGAWSQPWEDAGYEVFRFDIQNDPELGDVNNFSTEFFADWFGDFEGKDIYAILAATPCTDFASSGARHFAAKDEDGRTVASVKLVHQTLATIEYFKPAVWAMENPVGRIEKLGGLPPWRMTFDPNHMGDPYTKKTILWGRFDGNLPVAPVEPTEGSKIHSQYGGASLATKNARSITPEGFAYSFFMANNAADNPAMEIAGKFDRLDRGLIEQAVAAGVTKGQIEEAVEDFYYMDLDDDAANQAIRELLDEKAGGQNESVQEPNLEAARALIAEAKAATGIKSVEEKVRKKLRDLASKTPISDEKTVLALDIAATRMGMGEGSLKALEFMQVAAPEPEAPPAAPQVSAEQAAAQARLDAAIGDLGELFEDVIGKAGGLSRVVPNSERQQKLIPILSRIMSAAFELGYIKFKANAAFVLNTIRAKLGNEAADLLTIDNLQGAYISMAGSHEGASTKREVIDVESLDELADSASSASSANKAAEVEQAAANVDPAPSDAQKDAGNFKKGHVNLHGLDISIETAKNAYRSGKNQDGSEWKVQMKGGHYGYITGWTGADKEHLDIFIGEEPELDRFWIVNQSKEDSPKFDEHKVMVGYKTIADVLDAYRSSYSVDSGMYFANRILDSVAGPYTVAELEGMKGELAKAAPITGKLAYTNPRIKQQENQARFDAANAAADKLAHVPAVKAMQERFENDDASVEELEAAVSAANSPAPAPRLDGERKLTSEGNPIFEKGERVKIIAGPFAGRHGEVVEANSYTMTAVMIFSNQKPTNNTYYSYSVKSDAGASLNPSDYEMEPETGERPEVNADPLFDNVSLTPLHLHNTIISARNSLDRALADASRARKPANIKEHKDRAAIYRAKLDSALHAWQKWAKLNPEEAAKIDPKLAPVSGPAVSSDDALESAGLKITKSVARNGKDVWEVTGNTREHGPMLKAIGARWWGPKQAWSFFNGDPTAMIAEKLGARPATAEAPSYDQNPQIERLQKLMEVIHGERDTPAGRSLSLVRATIDALRTGTRGRVAADVLDDASQILYTNGFAAQSVVIDEVAEALRDADPLALSEITVTVNVIEAESGLSVEVEESADVALADVDERMNLARSLLECLAS